MTQSEGVKIVLECFKYKLYNDNVKSNEWCLLVK